MIWNVSRSESSSNILEQRQFDYQNEIRNRDFIDFKHQDWKDQLQKQKFNIFTKLVFNNAQSQDVKVIIENQFQKIKSDWPLKIVLSNLDTIKSFNDNLGELQCEKKLKNIIQYSDLLLILDEIKDFCNKEKNNISRNAEVNNNLNNLIQKIESQIDDIKNQANEQITKKQNRKMKTTYNFNKKHFNFLCQNNNFFIELQRIKKLLKQSDQDLIIQLKLQELSKKYLNKLTKILRKLIKEHQDSAKSQKLTQSNNNLQQFNSDIPMSNDEQSVNYLYQSMDQSQNLISQRSDDFYQS